MFEYEDEGIETELFFYISKTVLYDILYIEVNGQLITP